MGMNLNDTQSLFLLAPFVWRFEESKSFIEYQSYKKSVKDGREKTITREVIYDLWLSSGGGVDFCNRAICLQWQEIRKYQSFLLSFKSIFLLWVWNNLKTCPIFLGDAIETCNCQKRRGKNNSDCDTNVNWKTRRIYVLFNSFNSFIVV